MAAGVKRRGLARSDSDPAKRPKGGVAGRLLKLRTEALVAINRACQAHGAARTNVATRWEALRAAGHVHLASAPPDIVSWLGMDNDTLAELRGPAKKDFATWTNSNAGPPTQHLFQLIASLETAATSINVCVAAAEDRVKRQRKAEVADLRRAQSERTRLLAPWRPYCISPEARVPMPLLRHTLDNGVLIASHGDKRNVCMVDCHDGCGAPLIDTRPWLLAFSTRGPGSDMARLAGAIGERRINENMAKAEAFQEQDANRVSCDTRLVPMGGGQNHGEELAWVPAAWRKSSHTPEALRSRGTPWLLSHDIAAARQLPAHWPVPGVGHFLSVQRGDMVACVIPLSPLLERGCSMHECVTFLCHLPWKTLEAFVCTHCLYAELLPGRALWVPYGWRRVLLTRTATSISHVLHIPYVCTRMLQTATFKAEIVAFAKQATQEWSSTMGRKPCLSLAKEAQERLGKVTTLEDEHVDAAPVTPLSAIEDARE